MLVTLLVTMLITMLITMLVRMLVTMLVRMLLKMLVTMLVTMLLTLSVGDRYGPGIPAKNVFLPFGEARERVRALQLLNRKQCYEWYRTGKRPHDIPHDPDRTYRDAGWLSWADWLGCVQHHTYIFLKHSTCFTHFSCFTLACPCFTLAF
jgi:hypothetical protein